MFASKDRKTLQLACIAMQLQKKHELIQYKEIFTYKRLKECEKLFSKYISEFKKAPSPARRLSYESAMRVKDIISYVKWKKTNAFIQQRWKKTSKLIKLSSLLPDDIVENIIKVYVSDLEKLSMFHKKQMEQSEFEAVVNALKEIKEIAKDHDETGEKLAKKKGMLFKSRFKNDFKELFEKFNILIDEESESDFAWFNFLAKIKYLIAYEKEEFIHQRQSLTP